ncbi:MAG: hypothetical protein M3N30_10975, partial [Bacteroidota bacterium]|nr:hypothetical protein [Bacteroidota bacterium]
MKKRSILISLSIYCFSVAFSQTVYHSAIGIRLGTGYYDLVSASYKTFLYDSPGAVEFNLGVQPATHYST